MGVKGRRYKLWWSENSDGTGGVARQAKKVVSKEMEAPERELKELSKHPNKVFKLLKSVKKDGKDVEGGRCMRGIDGRLKFSEKDRGKVWKEHMKEL